MGKEVAGHVDVAVVERGVMQGLKAIVSGSSWWANRLGVSMHPDGQLDGVSLRQAAGPRVIA
jgi:hypothetical protein